MRKLERYNADGKGWPDGGEKFERYDADGKPVIMDGGGTVTSVALSADPSSVFNVTGSPVTGAGTLVLELKDQADHTFLAGPLSGGPSEPGFRVIDASDIPDLSGLYLPIQPGANWTVDAAGSRMGAIGGAAVAAQKLNIYTGADANKGLVIRAFSATQSGNLFEWRNSAGTILGSISAIGNVLIGGAFTDANIKLYSNNSLTADPGAVSYALFVQSGINAGATTFANAIYGAYYNLFTAAGQSGTVTAVVAQRNVFLNAGSGIVSSAIGNQITINNSGSGSITSTVGLDINVWLGDTAIALNVANNTAASGTTKIGLKIGNVSGATNNFAIQTNAGLVVFNDGGDANADLRAEGDADPNLLFADASTDRVGFGLALPSTKVHGLLTDSGTNTVVNVLTVGHDSSGTPAAGFGTGLIIEGKSSTTASQSMGRLTYEWVVATHASRTARAKWTVFDTAEREGMRIEASGTAPLIGFYGHAAAAQSAAYTPSNVTTDRSYNANSVTIDELADVVGTLIADLQAVGLVG